MSKSQLTVQEQPVTFAVLVRILFIHLRLHFQLLLAPIFLWGYLLTGQPLTWRFGLAFLAFHLFLYGGTTAFNSYYDQDEGPVGGLERPPPALPALLPFSLVWQAIGAVLAALVSPPFFLIYLIIFLMGTAYSHPRWRWKSRPLAGLLTVAIGQGILAGLGGWLSAYEGWVTPGGIAWLGIVAVALITTGFYPITQIYQVEEDLTRGDLTFAAWAGPQGTFAFAISTMALAALLLLWVMAQVLGLWQAILVAVCYLGLLAAIVQWSRHYDATAVIANFRRVMRLYMLTSSGFLLFLAFHLLLIPQAN